MEYIYDARTHERVNSRRVNYMEEVFTMYVVCAQCYYTFHPLRKNRNMKASSCYETSVANHLSTLYRIPEACNLVNVMLQKTLRTSDLTFQQLPFSSLFCLIRIFPFQFLLNSFPTFRCLPTYLLVQHCSIDFAFRMYL